MPVGARFSAPDRTDPGAHPAVNAVGTGAFTGVNRPKRGSDYPPPPSEKIKERVELYLDSYPGPSWPIYDELYTTTSKLLLLCS